MSMDKVIEAIKRYKRFLIMAHIGLEGDSIGSQFAFQILLKGLGKEGVVANEAPPPELYDFLGIKNDIITDLNIDIDYDAVVVLDCPVIKRIGKASAFLKRKAVLINIDHHISNANFGDINWVEPRTSSCGEMIYKLFKALDVPIDYKCALFLYAAILTDTGSFAYETTTSTTHTIAAELIEKGLKPDLIYQTLYESRTIKEMRLLAEALSTINFTDGGSLAYMYVSKKMLDRFKLGMEVTEGFINYARSIKGVEVAIIFLENPSKRGQIHISFRSKGKVDVDKLASLFDGGGHKNASGCIVKGALKPVMKKVLSAVRENI